MEPLTERTACRSGVSWVWPCRPGNPTPVPVATTPWRPVRRPCGARISYIGAQPGYSLSHACLKGIPHPQLDDARRDDFLAASAVGRRGLGGVERRLPRDRLREGARAARRGV